MSDAGPKPRFERAREALSDLLGDWRLLLERVVEEAEEFTRQKPSAGLAAAFAAGVLLISLFRRR